MERSTYSITQAHSSYTSNRLCKIRAVEFKENGVVKDKCRLLLIKKNNFLNILSKYDKALEKFKMISLFRDDYFNKLRKNVKTKLKDGIGSFISHIETNGADLSDFNDKPDFINFIKNNVYLEDFRNSGKDLDKENVKYKEKTEMSDTIHKLITPVELILKKKN